MDFMEPLARSRRVMSERLSNSAGEALRQAILVALREINARLSGDAPSDADIHLARRAAKRARALARLAPQRLDTLARQTRKHVGEARRMLGNARDAQVRRATLARLAPRLDEAHAILSEMIDKPDEPVAAIDKDAVRISISALVRDWTLCDADGDRDAIIEAAADAYRKARKRAARAKSGGARELHRWRSAVVDLEYHAAFLAGFAPKLRGHSGAADRLRRHLGDINDLDELVNFARGQSSGDQQRTIALRRLEHATVSRRARLLAKAFHLGETLLTKSPARWAADVKRSCAT